MKNKIRSFREFCNESKKFKSSSIDPRLGINLFDLDETLVLTTAKIYMTTDKETFSLTPQEFNSFQIQHDKHKLDFSEFDDIDILKKGQWIQWTLDILKKTYEKGKAVGIITARSDKDMIRQFFLDNDIDIHPELIYTVNSPEFRKKYGTRNVAELKKYAVLEIIEKGFTKLRFFDDDKKNIREIQKLGKEENVDIEINLVKDKWIPKMK